jgi:hypothetical protein
MFVKMLTHSHMVIYTWWCWHIREGGGVLCGKDGFGVLSPSRRACEARFRCFRGDETLIFYCAEGRKKWRSHRTSRCWETRDRRAWHTWQTWLCNVYRLTLACCAALHKGGGNGRAGVRATDADISVCRLHAEWGNWLAQRQTPWKVLMARGGVNSLLKFSTTTS